jgi:hypothetical protein
MGGNTIFVTTANYPWTASDYRQYNAGSVFVLNT